MVYDKAMGTRPPVDEILCVKLKNVGKVAVDFIDSLAFEYLTPDPYFDGAINIASIGFRYPIRYTINQIIQFYPC